MPPTISTETEASHSHPGESELPEWLLTGTVWALGWSCSEPGLYMCGEELRSPGKPLSPEQPRHCGSMVTLGTGKFIRNGTDGLK